MDELNIAAEKETELQGKATQLEEDVRKEKGFVLELQGKSVLAQKQIALLEETIKGYLLKNISSSPLGLTHYVNLILH